MRRRVKMEDALVWCDVCGGRYPIKKMTVSNTLGTQGLAVCPGCVDEEQWQFKPRKVRSEKPKLKAPFRGADEPNENS